MRIQNNPLEYWFLVDFVCRGCLGTLQEYMEYFAAPVAKGAAADASFGDVEQMKRRAYVLHRAMKPLIQYKEQYSDEVSKTSSQDSGV